MTALFSSSAARAVLLLILASSYASATEPILTRVPNAGLQPRAILDDHKTLHLVYFKGEPTAGDLFYVHRSQTASQFSKPVQINSEPGSAVAIGTIRGAQIALGKDRLIHVVWNGNSNRWRHSGSPLLYTRLNQDRHAFEPEKDVITYTSGLDGGGSIAADGKGAVYAVWHAAAEKGLDESKRAVFLAISKDNGVTFERERRINPEDSGACACCGLKSFADGAGHLAILYRGAKDGSERDEILLTSNDAGASFQVVHHDPWKTATCPMSSAWLAIENGQTFAAWETTGHVRFATLDLNKNQLGQVIQTSAGKGQKYPAVARNAKGETLLVWCEGIKWGTKGTIHWQLFDQNGRETEHAGEVDSLPPWSFAAAIARPDERFEIIY